MQEYYDDVKIDQLLTKDDNIILTTTQHPIAPVDAQELNKFDGLLYWMSM